MTSFIPFKISGVAQSEAKANLLRCFRAGPGWWAEAGQPKTPDPELLDNLAETLFIRRAAEWNIGARQAKVLFYRQKEQGTMRYLALTRQASDVLTALKDAGYVLATKADGRQQR